MKAALGMKASVPTKTWVDHTYSCPYEYPNGRFVLSVKELSSWAQTLGYFHSLGRQLGVTPDLGEPRSGCVSGDERFGRGAQGLEGPAGRRDGTPGTVRGAAHEFGGWR